MIRNFWFSLRNKKNVKLLLIVEAVILDYHLSIFLHLFLLLTVVCHMLLAKSSNYMLINSAYCNLHAL